MSKAIAKAAESVSLGGFPAGAIIVKNNEVIGSGVSVGGMLNDPTSHAEVAAIRDACRNIQSSDLSEAILFASMQPCIMCFAASVWSSLSKIVYACPQRSVNPEYYGGNYDLAYFQNTLFRPVVLEHCVELERDSLDLVVKWEAGLCRA